MQVDAMGTGAFPLAGRRRVSQLSKDEWRESLEQQLREKEELKKAQVLAKRCGSQPTQPDNQLSEYGESAAASGAQQQRNDSEETFVDGAIAAASRAGGRRFVRAMTADEWKASLVEQIREKERQRQNRGMTAPTEATIPERLNSTTETLATITVTTLPQAGDDDMNRGRRRRGVQPQQTREDFLRGLQEQIELRKKQEDEAHAVTKSRGGRHGRRRVIEDDDDGDGFWPPLSVPTVKPKNDPPPVDAIPLIDTAATGGSEEMTTRAPSDAADSVESVAINAGTMPAQSTAVALDPAALSRLFELCEGMKQQNEELKQQLREQQTVLATISEKTMMEAEKSSLKSDPSVQASKKQSERNDIKSQSKNVSVAKSKLADRKNAAKKTPGKPSALPTTINGEVEKISTPKRNPTRASIELELTNGVPTAQDRVGANPDFVASAPMALPTVALRSRLVLPRVVPRLRKPQSITTKANGKSAIAVLVGTADVGEVTSIPVGAPKASTDDTIAHDPPPSLPEFVDAANAPRLPRLAPSPPIHQLEKPPSSPSPSVSLHAIPSRVPHAQLASDVCLDATSSTQSTLITRLRNPITPNHQSDPFDLEACSSSATVLIGRSTMVPYESAIDGFC